MGCLARSSQPANTASTARPPPIPPSVRALPQPASGASMMENTRTVSPARASSAPGLSSPGASGCEDAGTKPIVPAIAIAARITLTAKADRQENHSSRVPVASRPSRALPPATAAQTETARVRAAGGNVPVMVDSVAGMTRAAPRPMTPRSRISSLADDAVMATAEPAPNTASPASSARRRPYRSPRAPAGSSSAAKTSE
jgi:hypothetical protein